MPLEKVWRWGCEKWGSLPHRRAVSFPPHAEVMPGNIGWGSGGTTQCPGQLAGSRYQVGWTWWLGVALWLIFSVQVSSSLVKEIRQDSQRNRILGYQCQPTNTHAGSSCLGCLWSLFMGLDGQLELIIK